MGINKKGELFYTVLFLPQSLIDQLPLKKYPRLRIEGEMHGIEFGGAVQPAKGRYYLLISRDFMQKQGLALGDLVDVRFNIADQDHVDVPTELATALANSEAANAIWQTLTPGKKRGYAAHVAAAKQPATRERRAAKMIGFIVEGKNSGGRPF